MKNTRHEEVELIDLIIKPFKNKQKRIRILIAVILFLNMVLSFFSVTNWMEALVGVLCIISLFLLGRIKGKVGDLLCCSWALVMVANLFVTPFLGAPFFGLFSDESLQERAEERFYNKFAEALYELSVYDYENAMQTFKQIEGIVPREDLLEYYLWYGEAAIYAQEYEIANEILEKGEKRVLDYSTEERDILFKTLPICKMVNYVNMGELDTVELMARQYSNTNEQIFCAFEIYSLCAKENITEYEEQIGKLIAEYFKMNDTFESVEETKLDLLSISAWTLIQDCPEYAVILFAQIYDENKYYFYENYLYCYPRENNLWNMRWFSYNNLNGMKEIFDEGWSKMKERPKENLNSYFEKVEALGYYLGAESLLGNKIGIQDLNLEEECKLENGELYNVIPLNENEYLGTWIEPMVLEGAEQIEMVSDAYFYYFTVNENEVSASPLIINGENYSKTVTMNKLFLIEKTKEKNKFLIETIEGTGEYLYIEVLDIDKQTCTALEHEENIYHASRYKFDGNDSYTVTFEIDNCIDANMESKVGGKIVSKIDFENNVVQSDIIYPDPAIEFYVEERNDALVFPLENLDNLNGKKIKNKTLLEKIRQNSIPYYKYSLIQNSYNYSFEATKNKLSGVTIVYDINTDSEASFFYLVKREGEEIRLLRIYEIVDNKLKNVY